VQQFTFPLAELLIPESIHRPQLGHAAGVNEASQLVPYERQIVVIVHGVVSKPSPSNYRQYPDANYTPYPDAVDLKPHAH
jgi:hypothetical protein